jgi:protein-tyrosine phosphatase
MIGMTLCPGKQGESQYGARWARDLATDLEVIIRWGASALVTVMESEELKALKVEHLGEWVMRAGLDWFQLPIVDGGIPDWRVNAMWTRIAGNLSASLRAGQNVLVHCRGGLGRTGLITCLLLIELDYSPREALTLVRAARQGTVETEEQETFVLNYQPRLGQA